MSYASEVDADNPVAWYRCQESSGLIQDSSGNGNHATSVTGTPTYSVAGPIESEPSDTAIYWSDDPTYFLVDDDVTLDVGDVFTLEAWIKRHVTGSPLSETILNKALNAFFFGIIDNRLELHKSDVSEIVESTVTITDTTTWHHCVVTKNGSSVFLYLDGVDVTGTVTDATIASNASQMGVGAAGPSVIDADMDELAIYATALSQARVQAHYNAAFEEGAGAEFLFRIGGRGAA